MATLRVSDGLLEELRKRKFIDGRVRSYEEVIREGMNLSGMVKVSKQTDGGGAGVEVLREITYEKAEF